MRLADNTIKCLFLILFCLVLSTLFSLANSLSISYGEALNLFINHSVLSVIIKSSTYLFGMNNIVLRFPFFLFYVLSVFLMYLNTKIFFKKESDRYINLTLFMALPGILSASLLVNSAILVTFFTLFYIYYYNTFKRHSYALLFLFLFIDNSFAILFLALFFYSLNKKDTKLLIISLLLFGISMSIYGFDAGGKPRGFLLDTFAIYASIFSPLLFIYFLYSIYRAGIKKNRTLTWYISSTSLLFSLLLSLRQRVYIEDYAPFVVIFLPYMIKIFFHTIRVRLPQFRKYHYYISFLVLIILFLNILGTLFYKSIYLLLDNPKKHFAYKYNIAKEVSKQLKKNGINKIESDDKKLLLRLRFYGIKKGNDYFVSFKKQYPYDKKILIKYFGKKVATIYVSKK